MVFSNEISTLVAHVVFIIMWHSYLSLFLNKSGWQKGDNVEIWLNIIAHILFTLMLNILETVIHL